MEAKDRTNLEQILQRNLMTELRHGICVSNLAYQIAKELDMKEGVCNELAVAGIVHDIGKMKLTNYLNSQFSGTMTVEEMRYVRMHSKFSYQILKEQGGYTPFILESILFHHENYDGSGYPENLKGQNIPSGARILRVCDVFAALTSNRPYREAFTADVAVELMIDEVKNFDMKIFLAFLNVVHEVPFDKILGTEWEEEKYWTLSLDKWKGRKTI